MRIYRVIFFSILILALTIVPRFSLFAAEFNRNHVISDDQMFDSTAMTVDEVQRFLELHQSFLATFMTRDANGETKTAAEIIADAAHNYEINPQVILVMLQKEQGLINDQAPTAKQLDWALGYGVCDDCSMNDPALMIFRGFGLQVDRATQRLQWFKQNASSYKQIGTTYIVDGQQVTPANQATAALYSYTPHIQGNYTLWKLWQKWFHQYYPDGTLLQAYGEHGVWLLQYGLKRPIMNRSALVSRYNTKAIVAVSRAELDKYETGSPIKFSNYSLLEDPEGEMYLVVDDAIRHIDSAETFRSIGFNPEELIEVTAADIDSYQRGPEITQADNYPMGALLQNNKTGAVFFVQAGVKHPLIAAEIMQINYPKHAIISVNPETLDQLSTGDMIKFKDGTLVKSPTSPVIYVIAEGQKRPISTWEVFKKLGYKKELIKTVSEASLKIVPLGEYIDLTFKSAR